MCRNVKVAVFGNPQCFVYHFVFVCKCAYVFVCVKCSQHNWRTMGGCSSVQLPPEGSPDLHRDDEVLLPSPSWCLSPGGLISLHHHCIFASVCPGPRLTTRRQPMPKNNQKPLVLFYSKMLMSPVKINLEKEIIE